MDLNSDRRDLRGPTVVRSAPHGILRGARHAGRFVIFHLLGAFNFIP